MDGLRPGLLEDELRERWGFDSFLPLQREAVEAALGGRDCLVVMPTGAGKSLCYQLPAAAGQGLVLVVSPLIALMDDQVAAARTAGLAADALHSNLGEDELGEARRRLAAGRTRLLYTSPERLLRGDLSRDMGPQVRLAAVDEAQCVSHWGRDFRPEYARLGEALNRLPGAARMALTATATSAVQEEICACLGLRAPLVLAGHPDRPNLVYRVVPRRDPLAQISEVLARREEGGAIVYAHTRRDAEALALGLQRDGVPCAAYHAGLPAGMRRGVQEEFVGGSLDIVVATVAFGMGIDRPDVRCVIHANAPRSLEHYQQESGRAGRDGLPAECVMLFAGSDLESYRRLARWNEDLGPERLREIDQQLYEVGRYARGRVCRHRVLSEHFGAPYPPGCASPRGGDLRPGCGACDICLGKAPRLPAAEAYFALKQACGAAMRSVWSRS